MAAARLEHRSRRDARAQPDPARTCSPISSPLGLDLRLRRLHRQHASASSRAPTGPDFVARRARERSAPACCAASASQTISKRRSAHRANASPSPCAPDGIVDDHRRDAIERSRARNDVRTSHRRFARRAVSIASCCAPATRDFVDAGGGIALQPLDAPGRDAALRNLREAERASERRREDDLRRRAMCCNAANRSP